MFYRSTVPISVPALVKRIPYTVKVFYADEVTVEDIKKARIVIIAILWFYDLENTRFLAEKVKNIKPGIFLIAGGLTASLYSDKIIQSLEIDFLIKGDEVIPLPKLVESLIEDQSNLASMPDKNGNSDENKFLKFVQHSGKPGTSSFSKVKTKIEFFAGVKLPFIISVPMCLNLRSLYIKLHKFLLVHLKRQKT